MNMWLEIFFLRSLEYDGGSRIARRQKKDGRSGEICFDKWVALKEKAAADLRIGRRFSQNCC